MKKNLLLMFISVLFCLIVVVLAEGFCRLFFTDINFRGIGKDLFIANAYGASKGNAKNAEAISYGIKVYTDENGFRIDPGLKDNKNCNSAILILGDSVGFGTGVMEDKTFAGLLRKDLPDVRIYNSSVISYGVPDYKNVVDYFIPDHKEISRVYLVYCLNDISYTSSQNIDEYLKQASEEQQKLNKNEDSSTKVPVHFAIIQKLRENRIISFLNYSLDDKSKLYLLIRQYLIDPSLTAFLHDWQLYSDANINFEKNLYPLLEVQNALKKQSIEFTVLIPPYEAQLRFYNKPEYRNPQRMIEKYFDENNIRYIDTFDEFLTKLDGLNSRAYYLYGDHAHLSELGHKVMYDIIIKDYKR